MRTWWAPVVLAALAGCGRLGFDALGTGSGGDDQPAVDAALGVITSGFLRCDGVDDGVRILLPGDRPAYTIEARVRVVDPANEMTNEDEIITVSRSANPGVLEGFRVLAEGPAPAVTAAPPRIATRLEMFRTSNGNTDNGVSGPDEVLPTWGHVAMVYNATTSKFEIFRDGRNGITPITLGLTAIDAIHLCGDGSGRFLAVEIDWIRVSTVARYAAPFTPSAAAPAVDAQTVSLMAFDSGTVSDLVAANNLAVTGAVTIEQP